MTVFAHLPNNICYSQLRFQESCATKPVSVQKELQYPAAMSNFPKLNKLDPLQTFYTYSLPLA